MRKIYGYIEPHNAARQGMVKVGQTDGDVDTRIAQQFMAGPTKLWRKVVEESGITLGGSTFSDHDVRAVLRSWVIPTPGGEWVVCSEKEVCAAIKKAQGYPVDNPRRYKTFSLRPAQRECIEFTEKYLMNCQDETSEVLWNCVPRFGKCFAAYKLIERMGWKKVLIVTRFPAVKDSWRNDLNEHMDFQRWVFVDRHNPTPVVGENVEIHFLSIQNLQGPSEDEIKACLAEYYDIKWDLLVVDEAHYGADAPRSKKEIDRISASHKLSLSGTPYRALSEGRFSPEQTFDFTYVDLQRIKRTWVGPNNPYEDAPDLKIYTYRVAEDLKRKIQTEGKNEFDLNVFFGTTESGNFRDEGQVREFLDGLWGDGPRKPVDSPLKSQERSMPKHMLWRMSGVAECDAMANLLKEIGWRWEGFKIVVAAGPEAGDGEKALEPVRDAIASSDRTITLTCGKLQMGVSIPQWDAVLLLCNMESPETYVQVAMRATTPWRDSEGKILKPEAWVFDFDPNRVLRIYEQIADFQSSSRGSYSPHKEAADLLRFMPVLTDDSNRVELLNAEILFAKLGSSSPKELAGKLDDPRLADTSSELLAEIVNNEAALAVIASLSRKTTKSRYGHYTDIEISSEPLLQNISQTNDKDLGAGLGLPAPADPRLSEIGRVVEKAINHVTTVGLPRFLILSDEKITSLEDLLNTGESQLFEREMGLKTSTLRWLVCRTRGKWDKVIRDFSHQKSAEQE